MYPYSNTKDLVSRLHSLRAKDERLKSRQKLNFDSHHGARELPPLAPGDTVWVPDRESEGSAGDEVAPHSYEVTTPDGTYRRNRRDLIRMNSPDGNREPEQPNPPAQSSATEPTVDGDTQQTSETQVRRSTWTSHPPDRFDPSWS